MSCESPLFSSLMSPALFSAHKPTTTSFSSFKSLSQVPSKMSSSCVSSGRLPEDLDQIQQRMIDLDVAEVIETLHYRIFVATWNVGGKSPPSNLNLDDWLHSSPLNAGNVLRGEDNAPAKKWIALIRRALNSFPGNNSSSSSCPKQMDDEDFGGKTSTKKNLLHCHSFQTLSHSLRYEGDALVSLRLDCRHSVCTISQSYCKPHHRKQLQLASFQGSISMSMSLHQTSFCFICSHLASGEKVGDKLRRNFDVMETLRKTKFSQFLGFWDQTTPERILEHE